MTPGAALNGYDRVAERRAKPVCFYPPTFRRCYRLAIPSAARLK